MQSIRVRAFGGIDQLELVEEPTPKPDAGEVRIRLTSIGLNHAELMGRRGEYRLSTGDPPFVPGLEGGGRIDAVGDGVTDWAVGDRVTLAPGITRVGDGGRGGSYRSHYLCSADAVLRAPDAIPDDQLGAIWLPYLTAWGCLAWLHGLGDRPADQRTVVIPAASSSLGLAAAQVVKALGGTAIGLTSSPTKVDAIHALPAARFDHLVVTHDADRQLLPFHRDLFRLTDGRGVDVFFDPVASGGYLNNEIKALAQHGVVYVYGLLGDAGPVDVTPLIRKHAAIRGWVSGEVIAAGEATWRRVCGDVLDRFADGTFVQHVAETFPLAEARRAHETMERGGHIGKLALIP
ncbi:MAG: zinc-dependent alcohol dehydrogenase family protein [Planctomycetota bacterium]